jgi:2-hydroxychromene-2-carboxylate isomerase
MVTVRAAPPAGPTVDFFYCFSCPWTYLAFVRLQETALRTGATIAYRPVVDEWLAPGSARPLPYAWLGSNPDVRDYAAKDLRDWARFCSVVIERPQPWPVRPEWAQRAAVLAIGAGLIRQYADAVFRAHFSAGRNIADRAVVLELAAGCGLSGAQFETRLASEATLAVVRDNVDELVRRRGFGSPTMFAGDDMYFGHDRVPLLESALMRAADRPLIAPGEHGRQ